MKSKHNLNFSFQPTGASGFSPEILLGLVEPIKKVKSSLKKALSYLYVINIPIQNCIFLHIFTFNSNNFCDIQLI